MWWRIATISGWLASAACILGVTAVVLRRQMPAMSLKMIPVYLFHGATAILVLFLLLTVPGS
jgi:hypothetical protein